MSAAPSVPLSAPPIQEILRSALPKSPSGSWIDPDDLQYEGRMDEHNDHQSTPCIFCAIVQGAAPASRVYEDELVTAFMDIQPVNPGHVLVIPNNQAADPSDLPGKIGGRMDLT